jgi:alpha-mannosidase
LPQILIKSGAETFWTTKIFANDKNPWPFSNFTWKGIDGSEIYTYAFTYNWDGVGNNGRFRRTNRYPASEFNRSIVDSHMMRSEIESRFTKDPTDFNKNMPVFYGLGDGGRGPLELEIMFADSLAQMQGGKHVTQQEFFSMQKGIIGDRQFVWDDELYLEFHRGTKTTQVEVKHYNRRAECWAIAAENLLTIMNVLYSDVSSLDKQKLFEMWRKILFNQFHDILPGSSIPDVYQLAIKEQNAAINQAQLFILDCLKFISCDSDEILVFNPYNWKRSEYLTIGQRLFYIENMPGLSIQRLKLNKIEQDQALWNPITETPTEFIIENEYLQAIIRKDSGTLISLYSKTMQKEFLKTEGTYRSLGSGFRVFREQPQNWPAWNIDHYYFQKKVPVNVQNPARITIRNDGVKQVTCDYQFLNSIGTINFYLRSRDQMLQISIHTDMHDGKILVKYFIPINLKSEDVRCEIPYASVVRKRIPHTEFEKAKWEINTHKWIDISDDDCGLTIFNNNRYGFNATGKGVYITLTRTPVYPGVSPLYGSTRTLPKDKRPKYTDLVQFDYDFALFPHKESWVNYNKKFNETIWQLGQDFNLPLVSSLGLHEILGDIPTGSRQNDPPRIFSKESSLKESFIESSDKNIKIGSIKVPEWSGNDLNQLEEPQSWTWDKKTFIVRLVELNGESTHTTISFHSRLRIASIKEVNLLEMSSKDHTIELKIQNTNNRGSVELDFHKFEIKTLQIHLSQ